jgi:shikimate dehydrogenase
MTAPELTRLVSNDPFAAFPDADILGGIVGGEQPSKYSHSPALWNRFFESLGMSGRYTAFDLPAPDKMEEFLAAVFSLPGFLDLTVTNPYKARAFKALDSLPGKVKITERVRILQSLNHLTRAHSGGEILAANTDGQGLIRALKKRLSLDGQRVLLAGAGGAALSIGYELLREGAALTLVNIVPEDARALAGTLAPYSRTGEVSVIAWDAISARAPAMRVIISAITVSTPLDSAAVAALPGDCLFADIRYGAKAEFALAVRGAGRSCVDGRETLYGQFRIVAEQLPGLPGFASERAERNLDDIETWFCAGDVPPCSGEQGRGTGGA